MKNLFILVGGISLGYALNTETGKKLQKWSKNKIREQVNKFVDKINETISSN